MKINFTTFGTGLTGGTQAILEIAQRLAKRGYGVTITTLGSPNDAQWFAKKTGKILFDINYTTKTSNLFYKIIRRCLRPTMFHLYPEMETRDLVRIMPDCDVNIATTAPTVFSVFQSARGKKQIYYSQHFEPLFIDDLYYKKLHEQAFFLPLDIITVSSWVKNQLKRNLDINAQGVIGAGLDPEIYYPRNNKLKNKKRIISLGRKISWKGFWDLQQAMKMVFKQRKDIEWIVFSSHDTPLPTPEAPFYLAKSPAGNQLTELISSADILVNPSWHEGFAYPALEAMGCGTASVTTYYGAEDFAKDRENCLVVQRKNPLQIAQSILELLEDKHLAEIVINGGLKTAQENSWDKVINRWEEILYV